MNEPTPLNKPLIVFTLVVAAAVEAYRHLTPRYVSETEALWAWLGMLVTSPIIIAWIRALWNTLVPRITGWREITLWEAAGLSAIVFFLAG